MKVSLEDVKKAQANLNGVIRVTEVDRSVSLSKKLGVEIFLKHENQQYTGSFKLRGAYNKISSLSAEERKRGVIACSAGNHAQGVAFSAERAGVRSKIIMPMNAPLVKVVATRSYGAEVVQHGEVFDEALELARELEKKEGYTFVHPYEDPLIIAGQGTIGLEFLTTNPDLDTLIVPIGGGGLISGIATAVKAIRPQCRIIGVQSTQAGGMAQMFHGETPQMPKVISTIADGIAIKKPSPIMYESFIKRLVDEVVTVSDDEIAEAIVLLLERAKLVCEGSGAVGVAAAMNRGLKLGPKTGIILSGGNIDLNLVAKVIEKGQIRNGRLAQLSVVVDDLPGNLNRLTTVIANLRANVLEVHHDRVSQGLFLRETRIDFVLETRNLQHIEEIKAAILALGCRIYQS